MRYGSPAVEALWEKDRSYMGNTLSHIRVISQSFLGHIWVIGWSYVGNTGPVIPRSLGAYPVIVGSYAESYLGNAG